jgi:DNA-binding winged helix-turn-helix (wHTH) protein
MNSSDAVTSGLPDAVPPAINAGQQDASSTAPLDFTSEGSDLDSEALRSFKGLDTMSLATLDLPITAHRSPIAAVPAPAPEAAPRLRAVPTGTEARGFVLYVGLDEAKAADAGTDLGAIVAQLRQLAEQLAPTSETYAAVALAPRGAGGRDVDVVRLALQDPAALAKHRQAEETTPKVRGGVVIDISRKRLVLDGETAALTYKEFELLQYLVLREGRTIDRAELISSLWADGEDEDIPNERTIDVHVRRLRSKLGAYEDIVRTVRGVGYRFDRHADVSIRHASTPSPDFF